MVMKPGATRRLQSVSFQELDHDGLTDIVLITVCENDAGDYAGKSYRVGDVLFQRDGDFYRDCTDSRLLVGWESCPGYL